MITSFRSFEGKDSVNTAIQNQFLRSVKDCSKAFDLELIVVQYQEKFVKSNLKNLSLNYRFVSLGKEIPFYRYSLSEILSTGFRMATGEIIIYSTCDVVITPLLLLDIQNSMPTNGVVIPYPYPESVFGFEEPLKIQPEKNFESGLDIFAFSMKAKDTFMDFDFLTKHKLLGWGMFDHLIVVGCIQLGIKITKMSAMLSTQKFENDRSQNSETSLWLTTCHAYNVNQFRKYVGLNLKLLSLLTLKGLHSALNLNGKVKFNYLNKFSLILIRDQVSFLFRNIRLFLS